VLDLLAEGELDAGLVFNPVTTAGVEKVFEVLLAKIFGDWVCSGPSGHGSEADSS